MKQKIDNGVTGSPGRFPRPRFCQFEECGEPTTGYKYCEEHAAQVKVKQQAESAARRREINNATHIRKREQAAMENKTRLAAIREFPPMHKAFDIQHAPIEKSLKMFDAILSGDAGMVR